MGAPIEGRSSGRLPATAGPVPSTATAPSNAGITPPTRRDRVRRPSARFGTTTEVTLQQQAEYDAHIKEQSRILVNLILADPRYSHAFSKDDIDQLTADVETYVGKYDYAVGVRENTGAFGHEDNVFSYLADPDFIGAFYGMSPEAQLTYELRTGIIDSLVRGEGINQILTQAGVEDTEDFISGRPDLVSSFTREYAGKYASSFGNDYNRMVRSQGYIDGIHNFVAAVLLNEFANDPDSSDATKSYAVKAENDFIQSLRTTNDIDVIEAALGSTLTSAENPNTKISTDEAREIELLITGDVYGTNRLGTPLVEEFYLFDAETYDEFEQEYLASGATDVVDFYKEHWRPTIYEHIFPTNDVNTDSYDPVLDSRIRNFLDPNLSDDWTTILLSDIVNKIAVKQRFGQEKDKRKLWDEYVGKFVDGTGKTQFSLTKIREDVGSTIHSMLGDPTLSTFFEQRFINPYDVITGRVAPPPGFFENGEVPAFTDIGASLDYLYSYANTISPEPFINPSQTVEELNIRQLVRKQIGGSIYDQLPAFFQSAITNDMKSEIASADISDNESIKEYIKNRGQSLSQETITKHVGLSENGEAIINQWAEWGITSVEGVIRLGENGTINMESYDSIVVGEDLKTYGQSLDFRVKYNEILERAGLEHIPSDLLPTFLNAANSQKTAQLLLSDVVDPEEAERTVIRDADGELLRLIENEVDVHLASILPKDSFADAVTKLYGGARAAFEALGITADQLTSVELIAELESKGKAITDFALEEQGIDSVAASLFLSKRDAFIGGETGRSPSEILRVEKATALAGDAPFAQRVALIAASESLLDDLRLADTQGLDDAALIASEEFNTQLAERFHDIAFADVSDEAISGFLEAQALDPALVSGLSSEASALLSQLSGLEKFSDFTPEQIIGTSEFTEAFATARGVAEERASDIAYDLSPSAQALEDQQRKDARFSLFEPAFQERLSRFAGTGASDVLSTLDQGQVQRDFEQFVLDQQRGTASGGPNDSFQTELSSQTTGEVRTYEQLLDTSRDPDALFEEFLNQNFSSSQILGRQRQGRVSRIRTNAPTGGRQIRNPQLGVGL